jgi:hypothetical protein
MLGFVALRERQIFQWRLPRLLDKSVQDNHAAFSINIKQHAPDSILEQAASHFEDAITKRLANGHSDRPTELNGFDVFADPLSIFRGKTS